MSPFLTYIFKAGLIYSLCFLMYWLLFRRETFFKRNRVFLLFCLILPALIPLIQLPHNTALGEAVGSQGMNLVLVFENALSDGGAAAIAPEISNNAGKSGPEIWAILLWIYLAGFTIFFIRMIVSYGKVLRLILESSHKPLQRMILVITNRLVSPFSIFKWLVIPRQKENHPDLEKIIPHEMEHYRQKHSIDMLISELMLVFQWFNPFAWMLKSSVVRNNEYLVDQTLINGEVDQKEYQYALLNTSVGAHKLALVNGFNKSLIKKRIKMMNKRKTRLVNRAKEIVIIPFALILILAFSAYTNKATDLAQDQDRKIVKKEQKQEQRKIVGEETWTVAKKEERKIVGDDTWTIPQDQDKDKKKKGEKGGITIIVDGEEIMLKGASGVLGKDGDIKIIKLSELEDLDGKSISRDKLIERIKEIKSDDDDTIIMIKESDEEEGSVDAYALIRSKGDTEKRGIIFLKSEDGHIEMSTGKDGDRVIYFSESEGDSKRIHIRTDGKGDKDFLIVIDGKISTEEDLENLDSEKIYSITILDSEDAKKEFGDKAKDGVIKVTTK